MNNPAPVTRELIAFFVVACLLSWPALTLWRPPAPGQTWTAADLERAFTAVSFFFAFGPLLSAVVVTWTMRGTDGLRALLSPLVRWRIPGPCYASALLIPAAVQIATVLLWTFITGKPLSPPSVGRLVGIWTVGTVVGGLFLVTEETGWRGFALPRVQCRLNALAAGAVVGLMWGTWHLPFWVVIARATLPSASAAVVWIALFAVATMLLSVLLTWVFNSAGGSLLPMLLMHGSNNASGALAIGSLPDGGPIDVPFLASQAAVLLLVALLVVFRHGPDSLSMHKKVTCAVPVN